MFPVPKTGMENGVFFTTKAQCSSLWHLPVPTGGHLPPVPPFVQEGLMLVAALSQWISPYLP